MPETRPEYVRLFSVIKSHITWAKPMRSIWLIKTNRNRSEVMRRLRSAADANDKILVIEVTDDWIAYNLPESVINWMQEGLS